MHIESAMSELEHRSRIKECRKDIDEWLDLLCHNRFSTYLSRQLTVHLCRRIYSVQTIFDEIRHLENGTPSPSIMKKPKKLSGNLKGIWHVHHFQAKFLFKNTHLEVDRNSDLKAKAQRIAEGMESPDEVHKLVMEAWARRSRLRAKGPMDAGRMTGEWLLFAKYESEKYYLCLAQHGDSERSILRRVISASECFSQLSEWREEMMKRLDLSDLKINFARLS